MKRTYVLKRPLAKTLIRTFDAIGSFARRRSSPLPPSSSQVKNLLFIRLDQIGDLVTTLPAIDSLRTLFPNAEITGLVGTEGTELLYNHPDIDRLIILHEHWLRRDRHRKLLTSELRKLIPGLKSKAFDIGIDFRGDLRNILLMKWIGVKYTIGYGITGGGWLLDSEIPFHPLTPVVNRNLDCLSSFDKSIQKRDPFIDVSRFGEAQKSIDWLLNRFAIQYPFIAIHPHAGSPSKEWLLEKWFSLIQELLKRRTEAIVILGSDRKKTEQIISSLTESRVYNASGMTNLRELSVLLSRSILCISCDSGPAHISAAVGTPTVVIASGTNLPSVWLPSHPHVKAIAHPVDCSPCELRICPKERHWCVEGLAVKDVLKQIESMLHPLNR